MDNSVTNFLSVTQYPILSFNHIYYIIKYTTWKDRSPIQNIRKLPTPFDCLIPNSSHPCEGYQLS